MKDDRQEYDKLLKTIDGLDTDETLSALKDYSDKGNINATFHLLSSSRFLHIDDEDKLTYFERLMKQYDEEPQEFDSQMMIFIGHEYQSGDMGDEKSNDLEALKWFIRAYDLGDPDAARWILLTYEYGDLEDVDDEYCEWCIRVLRDADYYIENDTVDYNGLKDSRGTVGNAINALIRLANEDHPVAKRVLITISESGILKRL